MITQTQVMECAYKVDKPTGIEQLDNFFNTYPKGGIRQDDKPFYYRFLYHAAKYFDSFVEVGCRTAASSAHVVLGNPAACAWGIDVKDAVLFRHPRFKFLNTTSMDPALTNAFELKSVDVVFIDAAHDYRAAKADYEFWRPRVKAGGAIFMDDILAREYGVSRFWQEIKDPKIAFEHLHPVNWGFGVTWPNEEV